MKKLITTILIGALVIISQTTAAGNLFDKRDYEVYKNELSINSLTVSAQANVFENKHIKIKEDKYVYLGGQTVGVAFYTDGLFVTDTVAVENEKSKFINTANNAGIKKGDYIISANGVELNDISNFDAILKTSDGSKIKLKVRRDDKLFDTEIIPIKSKDGEYRLGLWMRDSAAGLGTITYVDSENNSFGALGHGICDNETGEMLKIKLGRIVECSISGIKKGDNGIAGELKGSFGTRARQLGDVLENTKFGLFGKMYSTSDMKKIMVGSKSFIEEGEAFIYSDFEDGQLKKYSIKILHINDQTYPAEKSMIIQVTDKKLIEKTGGIVQGLSGSPIVQNDKLIGAVTHVMINDATKGYGIFIENMLSAAA